MSNAQVLVIVATIILTTKTKGALETYGLAFTGITCLLTAFAIYLGEHI